MQITLHSLGCCTENFPLIQISSRFFYLSISPALWHKYQRVFSCTSCTSARHAGSFDCLMTSLILITMDNGRGHCAWWQSCKVPNQNPLRNEKRKMYTIKQIKICAESRDMLRFSPGSWQTSLGLGSMSQYSAQILICILQQHIDVVDIWGPMHVLLGVMFLVDCC